MINTKNKITKILLLFAFIFFIFGYFTSPVHAAKNIQYVWTATYDYSNKTVTSYLIETDKPNKLSSTYIASDNFSLTGFEDRTSLLDKTNVGEPGNGIYADAWVGISGVSAEDTDRAYASYITSSLSSSFNTALAQIIRDGNIKFNNAEDFYELSRLVAECGVSGSSCEYDGYTFTFRSASNDELSSHRISEQFGTGNMMGASADNYRALETKDGKSLILAVSLPKGYSIGQKLENLHSITSENTERITKTVSWKHFVLAAERNVNKGITSSNSDELQEVSSLETMIANFFKNLLNSLEAKLGIFSIEDMMLNRNLRDSVYYKGIVNHTWFGVVNLIHWVCQIVSVFAIIIGIVLAFVKRNISLVNPNARTSLKESLMNLFYAVLLLTSFNLVFYGLVHMNYLLVDMLSAISPPDATIGDVLGGGLASIIIGFILLFVKVKLNVTYLIRGVTIILLYATAPLFIISLIYGRKGKELFSTWTKELVGNIFMQSFHALVLTVYLLVLSSSTTSSIERIILAFSFLPLTQFFKEKFLGQNITDSASTQVSKGVGSLVSGGIGLAMMGAAAGVGALSGAGESIRDKVAGKQETINNQLNDSVFANPTNTKTQDATVVSSRKNTSYNANKAISDDAKEAIVRSQSAMDIAGTECQTTFSGKELAKKAAGFAGGVIMYGMSEAAELGASSVGADTGNIRHAQKISAGVVTGTTLGATEEIRDLLDERDIKNTDIDDYDYIEHNVSENTLHEEGISKLKITNGNGEDYNDKMLEQDDDAYLMAEISEDLMEPKSQQYLSSSINQYNNSEAGKETPIIMQKNSEGMISSIGYAKAEKKLDPHGKKYVNFSHENHQYNFGAKETGAIISPLELIEQAQTKK